MNRKMGMIASLITLAAVVGFALSMVIGSDFGSYFCSMFIAWGFVPLICALSAFSSKETKAFGYTSIAFAAIYAALIMLVYFAQITFVKAGNLSSEVSRILDYQQFGLFFSYDLLGYAFMALATFFVSFTIEVQGKSEKWLKLLLMIHGAFSVICVVMPTLGVFQPDMPGGDLWGILVLEFWCLYFAPICVLSYMYFRKKEKR